MSRKLELNAEDVVCLIALCANGVEQLRAVKTSDQRTMSLRNASALRLQSIASRLEDALTSGAFVTN